MPVTRRAALAAASLPLVLVAGACARPAGAPDPIDASLRESVTTIPVGDAGASIVVTTFRPQGAGPFPWIVLTHGTATTSDANRSIGRYRNLALMREWIGRGYAIVVVVRRGYGASGGARLADDYGGCARPDFRRAGEAAAEDVLAAVAWARSQRDLNPRRWMLVGQSSGGFASIYAASKRPYGLVAVLAFAPGRGGDPATRPGEPCGSDRLAELFASIAPQVPVPVLWFYAENDQYVGPRVQRLWFERFRAAGGQGQLVVVPPFPERLGHGVFPAPAGVSLWVPAVRRFLAAERVPLTFGA